MTDDLELDAWKRQWQSRDAVASELRRRVDREVRAKRYELLMPLTVTLLFGGGTLAWALVSGDRDAVMLTAATWAFIAITWLTSLWLRHRVGPRGAPAAATTRAFLEFTIQVCRDKRAGLAAAAALAPIFLVFMLVWRYRTLAFDGVGEYLLSTRVLVVLLVAALLGVLAWRKYRALGVELDNLRAMQDRFEADGGTH